MVLKKFSQTASPIRGGGFCLRQKPEGWKNLCSYRFCSERKKAYCRKFKELFSEGDSDNGDAPEKTGNKRGQRNFPTEDHYPENVEKSVPEADGFMDNFFFKRQRAEPRNFKTLNSRRNSHNRYAKENSRQNPFKPKKKSAEKEPEDISQSFHLIQSPFYKKYFCKSFCKDIIS